MQAMTLLAQEYVVAELNSVERVRGAVDVYGLFQVKVIFRD